MVPKQLVQVVQIAVQTGDAGLAEHRVDDRLCVPPPGFAAASRSRPDAVTVTMRWRASRPRTASTNPASTRGDRLRVRVVRSMPSSSASSPSTRGSRSLRRRMEYWLRLRPTGASAWSYTCVTRRLARRRRKQVHWLGVEERGGGVIDIPEEGSEAIMCICT